MQELFDEWVVACWQTRPHEGLSHTWGEGRDVLTEFEDSGHIAHLEQPEEFAAAVARFAR